ncbi:MAG: BTAD domain-containing putative transcriptional regulator [Thiohalobacterales bacterium]|nr:BTAD domain-containing putative transcriptional regulator [Thiohalobacterales bacterium]
MEITCLPPATDSVGQHAMDRRNDGMSAHVLRIYTLGRFSLARDGAPLLFPRKSPARPLQLLKALIASGGRQVAAAGLAGMLWPDVEGDQALRSFDTTLHRLRRFLGDDRLLRLADGRLTLNADRVWVDVWECERRLGRLRGLLAHHADAGSIDEIAACGERIMQLYRGHFLAREQSTCWSVSLEERLRSRFTHAMLSLGSFWESRGMLGRAEHCYRRGIEIDDLIETFYRRLMVCLAARGRHTEAIACYRQCRHILGVVLGIQPAIQTRDIYQSIVTQHTSPTARTLPQACDS